MYRTERFVCQLRRSRRPASAGARKLAHCGRLFTRVVLSALAFWWGSAAFAQGFPAKPVRIVVPVAAGGNLDLVTRALAQKLIEQIGQQFIVENRPGASSIVGTEFVAKSPPDGYTYLSVASTFASTAAVVPNVPYDPVKDFSGVSLTAWLPQILVVNPSVPVQSVKELIALAKRRPHALAYGTAGNGATAHMATELFAYQAQIKMTHVPYKGNAPALIDVVGGQISLMFDTISTSIEFVKAGKLRALGVTSPKRTPVLPEVPTISEAALPGYEAALFNAILAPKATPREILTRMHAEIARALRQPDIRGRFLQQGVELVGSESPEQCSELMRTETEKFVRIVKQTGIRAE
jgi:tripartite-type tricarboxylate transporter receptor subunit TctC